MAATADDLLSALNDVAAAVRDNVAATFDVQVSIVTMAAQLAGYAGQQAQQQANQNKGGSGSGGGGQQPGQGHQRSGPWDQVKDFASKTEGVVGDISLKHGFGAGAVAGAAGAFAVAGFAAFKFAEALKGAADDARRATDQLFQQMGRMGQVAPSLAMVFAERERNQIFRDRDVGEKVAGSARGLMDSENNLNNKTQNLDALAQDILNVIQEVKNNVIAKIIEPVDEIAAGIRAILVKLRILSADKPVYDLGTWLTEVQENQKRKDDMFAAVVDDMRQGAGGNW